MKITYLELLKMVEQKKQPKHIKYMGIFFDWDGCEYVEAELNSRLSEYLDSWTTAAQTTATFIEVIQL